MAANRLQQLFVCLFSMSTLQLVIAASPNSNTSSNSANSNVNTNVRTVEQIESVDASMAARWQKLSTEERVELLKSYQALRQLDDKGRQDLQQRMQWFSQLPKDKQQRMRDVWQNMSETEREYWKTELKNASTIQQREELRETIMQKYD